MHGNIFLFLLLLNSTNATPEKQVTAEVPSGVRELPSQKKKEEKNLIPVSRSDRRTLKKSRPNGFFFLLKITASVSILLHDHTPTWLWITCE